MGANQSQLADELARKNIKKLQSAIDDLQSKFGDDKERVGEALADKIDYSILSGKVNASELSSEILKESAKADVIVDAISKKINLNDLAKQIKTSDVAFELLKSTRGDTAITEAVAKRVDYEALAKKLDAKDFANAVAAANINTDDLATAIARNPGSLGDALSQKITSTPALMTPIATSLADNTTFAKTLSDLLTSPTEAYLEKLRGQKGETGNLASSKATIKESLYDKKYTMWCADGDYCELPAGTKGIKIGPWILQNMPNGALHFHGGNADDWSGALTPGSLHSAKTLYIHNGQLSLPDGWSIGQNGDANYLRFNYNGDVKGAVHQNGAWWGRTYGDAHVHDWARGEFNPKIDGKSDKGHQHRFRDFHAAHKGEAWTW
jgi:hypothetical protein